MADDVAVEKEDDDEFSAAFAESAKISEGESKEVSGDVEAPAEDTGFEDSFNKAASPQGAAEKKDFPDPAAKLAEMEKEVERLKQSERSQRGRVSALTRKLEEQRAAAKPPEPTKDEEDKAGDWEEFKEEFPEMAAIVESRLKKVESKVGLMADRVEKVAGIQDTIVADEIDTYKQTQFEELKEKHPDFEEVKASPMFAAYKMAAPPEIQAKIKSKHAEDASEVLDAFKEFANWKPKPPTKKSDIELINERRATALKQSQGISAKPMVPSRRDTESDDDFAAAFAEGAAKKEKMRSVRF